METEKVSARMEQSPLFISHKKVKRCPMDRADYNIYRGWELPKDEDGSDDGYLVEYLDGGKPNHPEHSGYISWSPKEQFDHGYTQVLEEYQERVVVEKQNLDDKIVKLNNFLIENSAKQDCSDLGNQYEAMLKYSSILEKRISLF